MVFSFYSFGFMIMQIILLFLQLFDYNRFLFFPPFMVLFLLTAGQSPIFLILIPNSGATLSGAGNRWFSVEVIILIILGPLAGYGRNLWSECSSGRWFGPALCSLFYSTSSKSPIFQALPMHGFSGP